MVVVPMGQTGGWWGNMLAVHRQSRPRVPYVFHKCENFSKCPTHAWSVLVATPVCTGIFRSVVTKKR